MLKEKAQGQQPEAESTNAPIRLRLLHSSDESPVMGLERREQAVVVALGQSETRGARQCSGRVMPSNDGTSRVTRECQARFCEGLRVIVT
jgi:hypothetical protein